MSRLVVKDRQTFALLDSNTLYTFLRTDSTALPEAELLLLADTATDLVEQYTGLVLRLTTFSWYLDEWPTVIAENEAFDGEGPIFTTTYQLEFSFPKQPTTAINSVNVKQRDGSWQVVDPSKYALTGYPDSTFQWVNTLPPVPQMKPDGLLIEFVAGYAEGECPVVLTTAIARVTAYLNEHRGDFGANPIKESGAATMLRGYRRIRL